MSRRAAAVFIAMALVGTFSGCGGDGPGNCPAGEAGTPPNCTKICPSGTLPPDCRPDCTQTNVYQDNGPLPARNLVYDDFSVPDSGRLDVTMDWTNAPSPMGFYLVPANTCTLDEFNARSCNFLMRSEPSSAKPRKIAKPGLAAGNYRWIVGNFASSDESVSLQIVLSKGSGCPAFGVVPPSVHARDGGEPPTAIRLQRR